MKAEIFEDKVRGLRDAVFGKPSSDSNWEGSKDFWTRPEEAAWLADRFEAAEKKKGARK